MKERSTELKVLLKRAGIKQVKIAELAGVSETTVSLVINGKMKSSKVEKIIREYTARVVA